jgi:hypothetical protein
VLTSLVVLLSKRFRGASVTGGRSGGWRFHISLFWRLTYELMFPYNIVMKRCSRCKQWLGHFAFSPNRTRPDGLQTFCRDCQRAAMREHYYRRLEYYLTKARDANRKRRAPCRRVLDELKARPCADCGLIYPPCSMDFDHVHGDKLFNVSDASDFGVAALLVEVAKCDLVCSNCHRERTQRRLIGRRRTREDCS